MLSTSSSYGRYLKVEKVAAFLKSIRVKKDVLQTFQREKVRVVNTFFLIDRRLNVLFFHLLSDWFRGLLISFSDNIKIKAVRRFIIKAK